MAGSRVPMARRAACAAPRRALGVLAASVLAAVGAHGASAQPYSTMNPADLGVTAIRRGEKEAPDPDRFDVAEGERDATGSFARPTNNWWTMMVLGQGPSEMENANGFAIPFILWAAKRGLSAATPFVLAQANQIENGFDSNINFVTLGAKDVPLGHKVLSHDPLSVTLGWGSPSSSPSASSPIVRGSPYLTMEYRNATPVFDTPQSLDPNIGLTVDGVVGKCPGRFEGRKFEVVLVQSDETWTIWSSHTMQVGCQMDGGILAARHPITGVVRAAVTNNCTLGRSAFHCAKAPPAKPEKARFEEALHLHHETYPVGAEIDLNTKGGDEALLRIRWRTRRMPYARGGKEPRVPEAPVAMAAMEHHRQMGLCSGDGQTLAHTDVFHRNLNGNLSLVVGNEWLLPYALLPISWFSRHGIAEKYKPALLAALQGDASWEVPVNYIIGAGDPYNAGKMLQRIGQLALIAEELGEHSTARQIGRHLASLVGTYARGEGHNEFVYDASWGGYISCGCLYDDCEPKGCNPNVLPADQCHCEPSQAYCKNAGAPDDCPTFTDPGMDFGNAYYNDHHFHWGYHIFAAAVAARLDPEWAAEHRERLLLYARDIANPSADDPYFPVWRHKDWYTGWSWASGIALGGGKPYRNGHNQESTSESINAYYGLQLLGDALGDHSMRDWGRVALAAEVKAAQTYWQIPPGSAVYPPILHEKTLMGILWQNLAQYQTWFGGSAYMVHGIQMVPFIPPSEYYLQPGFVNASYPIGAKDCGMSGACVKDGWVTLFTMQRAILEPTKAWEEALALPDSVFSGEAPAGNGNSRTATLYWIATRPQLQASKSSGAGSGSPDVWPPEAQCEAALLPHDESPPPPFSPPPPYSPPPPLSPRILSPSPPPPPFPPLPPSPSPSPPGMPSGGGGGGVAPAPPAVPFPPLPPLPPAVPAGGGGTVPPPPRRSGRGRSAALWATIAGSFMIGVVLLISVAPAAAQQVSDWSRAQKKKAEAHSEHSAKLLPEGEGPDQESAERIPAGQSGGSSESDSGSTSDDAERVADGAEVAQPHWARGLEAAAGKGGFRGGLATAVLAVLVGAMLAGKAVGRAAKRAGKAARRAVPNSVAHAAADGWARIRIGAGRAAAACARGWRAVCARVHAAWVVVAAGARVLAERAAGIARTVFSRARERVLRWWELLQSPSTAGRRCRVGVAVLGLLILLIGLASLATTTQSGGGAAPAPAGGEAGAGGAGPGGGRDLANGGAGPGGRGPVRRRGGKSGGGGGMRFRPARPEPKAGGAPSGAAPTPAPSLPSPPESPYAQCEGGGTCDPRACGPGSIAQCCLSGAVCPHTVCKTCSCPDCSAFKGN